MSSAGGPEVAMQADGGAVPAGANVRVLQGFYEGLELPIDLDWMVIGRGRGADIVIADPTISRAHAAIGWDGQDFYLQDLGSTNGSRVNGATATRIRLTAGDEIQLGKLRLRLERAGRG